MSRVIVVGGGAAGMMAAIYSAMNQNETLLLEQNEKLGKKIYITGKGRCNITNACEVEELFQSIVKNPKFMYSAIYGFDNQQVIDFFNDNGCPTKTERGNRVFPVSDHASDVIACLERQLMANGVKVKLHHHVEEILTSDGCVSGVKVNGEILECDVVIIATGGFSYQTTGSKGDGYRFAKELGHSVTDIIPSLVPMETLETYIHELQGLSLRNVEVVIKSGKKTLYKEFGEMLFTHYGVSGPLMLSASAVVTEQLLQGNLQAYVDLKPALTKEQLDKRVLREFEENVNRQFKNAIVSLFPSKLIPVMIELSGISPDKKVNEITRQEREHFVSLIKAFPFTLTGLRDFNEAIITRGGVKVKEIDPGTMESKLIRNLYFAGEVLDVDALTGGFNLQVAWSTGVLAGRSIV